MRRIVVIGTPGVGKTTLAQHLAAHYSYPFIDLDVLFWGPDWTPAAPAEFRERVETALAGPHWTVGANYSVARDLIWKRADTIVWLDYALPVTLWRLLRRTIRRIRSQEALWAGNRETWKAQFGSRDSLLLFALKTHHQRKARFVRELAQPEYRHLRSLRFTRPRACEQWLRQLGAQ